MEKETIEQLLSKAETFSSKISYYEDKVAQIIADLKTKRLNKEQRERLDELEAWI